MVESTSKKVEMLMKDSTGLSCSQVIAWSMVEVRVDLRNFSALQTSSDEKWCRRQEAREVGMSVRMKFLFWPLKAMENQVEMIGANDLGQE